jgi:uncharacterized cupredoxin-like copper-binding protein
MPDIEDEERTRMKSIGIALGLMLLAASGPSHAHGDSAKAAHAGNPAKQEQKPWGIAGNASAVTRTISIRMLDEMRFSPSTLEVMQGETVRLVMKNTGKLMHELVIGTKQDLDEHAALMMKFPGMEHEEPYMAHVAPGKTGEIVWTFNRAGRFDFACLVAGHYQSGMRGAIAVAQADTTMSEGEVRKVDKESRKITLKHGAIRNLDMPAMTMVFQVKDPALLDRVKQGDKVRFHVEKVNDAMVVTAIEGAK